ncbi:MAG: MucR family transcriptional regulator, partial [Marinoscillum sp.]
MVEFADFNLSDVYLQTGIEKLTKENNDTGADLLIELTAEIVAAYVSNNSVAANDLPSVISQVHAALGGTKTPVEEVAEKQKPAVTVRRSIQPDHLICLEDGQKFKSLKRHLQTHHGL